MTWLIADRSPFHHILLGQFSLVASFEQLGASWKVLSSKSPSLYNLIPLKKPKFDELQDFAQGLFPFKLWW